jgi:thiol-disulfide isomerase/thioredoxin
VHLALPHGSLQIEIAEIGAGFAAFPLAAGVAILRYRLYDIEIVVNRTPVYVALTALRGRPAVVNVWVSWCPPCRAELPPTRWSTLSAVGGAAPGSTGSSMA